ncbi:hypothetical protein SeLEV6574_g00174 [Synchytrium endobioticum]|nr:hypothetical protein SeLEV6574_g00174 [Synchytrium endobioticum]
MVDAKTQDPVVNAAPQVKRALQARHLQMIALGGTIGTGLFVASGSAIVSAGPAGALLSYVIVGMLVYGVVTALGEMATLFPISGSFNVYASRFVDKSLGFTMGWNYWASWAVTIPAELSAGGIVMSYWAPDVPNWAWALIFITILTAVNYVGVRSFGELEYWFSLLKVLAIIVFIIIGVCAVCGAFPAIGQIGFTYWHATDTEPAWTAFSGGFPGIAYAFPTAFYGFGGTELIGITAGEAKNPRKSVPQSIRGTLWRIILFYFLGIMLVGMLIPQNDPSLVGSKGTVETAPFVVVYQNIGISGAANVMNAVILISVLSAANSSIYAASRTLMGMADKGLSPRVCGYVNKRGVPTVSLAVSVSIGCVAFLGSIWGNGVVFSYLINILGVASLLTWITICATHLRFRAAYTAQGYDLKDLPFRTRFFPFSDYLAILIGLLVLASLIYAAVTSPFEDPYTWYDSSLYVGLPLFTGLYVIHKLVTKSPFVPLHEIDLITDRYVEVEEEKRSTSAKILAVLA